MNDPVSEEHHSRYASKRAPRERPPMPRKTRGFGNRKQRRKRASFQQELDRREGR